jgi:hypothetical protein
MQKNPMAIPLLLTPFAFTFSGVIIAEPLGGFVDGSSATLTTRNYYFNRDFSDVVGSNSQSKAEEWAQGFILDYKSGYTPGPVGFGLDAQGLLGIKLDSGPGRVGVGLLPIDTQGEPADEYSRLGLAAKIRYSQTVLRVGDLQPSIPILYFSDVRLLPPSYQGVSITSKEVAGLTLEGARLRSTHLRNEGGDEKMQAMLGNVPQRQASSDGYNYAGGEYNFNSKMTTVSAWYGQLEDIYQQGFLGLKHSQPAGPWTLGVNLGYYFAHEDGDQFLGRIDNRALAPIFTIKRAGHTVSFGYQAIYGDNAFPRVFANISPLVNETPTYEFANTDERSWQVRHEYDFAALGMPGLTSSIRWTSGYNVDTGRGFEGREHERDLDLAYIVQSGPLGGLGVRVRNAVARSNYRSDVDENRLFFTYTWKLL